MDLVGNVSEWTRSSVVEFDLLLRIASIIPGMRAALFARSSPFVASMGCNWSDIECATDPLLMLPHPNLRPRRTVNYALGFRCVQ